MRQKKVLLVSLIFVLAAGTVAFGQYFFSKDYYVKQEINPKISVKGLKLLMPEQEVFKILGAKGEEAPCVYGYEHDYQDLNLNIGFRNDNRRVRRVTVSDEQGTIFGVSRGMTVAEGKKILIDQGFRQDETSAYKFVINDYVIVTLKSIQGSIVDGVSIETKNQR